MILQVTCPDCGTVAFGEVPRCPACNRSLSGLAWTPVETGPTPTVKLEHLPAWFPAVRRWTIIVVILLIPATCVFLAYR